MRLRAEMRVWVEHALRAAVILALAVMLWQLLEDGTDFHDQTMSARGLDVRKLTEWSAAPKAAAIQVQLDRVPSAVERAWLAAVNGATSRVTWSGELPSLMVAAQPVASPTGGTNVFVAAPRGSNVAVSADGGAKDTVSAQHAGTGLTLESSANHIAAVVKGSFGSTAQRDSLLLRKLLVIGQPKWESKFVVAALEEGGWKVDALIRVAPGIEVTQGPTAVIDTSRYSAVIALDAAAAPYANRMMEFARTGGGVVLGSRAATLEALAEFRAGAVGSAPQEARTLLPTEPATLASLPLAPITSLRSDAVPLERRSGTVATAARRIGAGRALQVGYEDTWRWRISGGDGSVRDHRRWWTGIASSVAYAPRFSRSATARSADEAPMVGLVAGVGPRSPAEDISGVTGNAPDWMAWILVLVSLGLMGEVASRRTRGTS